MGQMIFLPRMDMISTDTNKPRTVKWKFSHPSGVLYQND